MIALLNLELTKRASILSARGRVFQRRMTALWHLEYQARMRWWGFLRRSDSCIWPIRLQSFIMLYLVEVLWEFVVMVVEVTLLHEGVNQCMCVCGGGGECPPSHFHETRWIPYNSVQSCHDPASTWWPTTWIILITDMIVLLKTILSYIVHHNLINHELKLKLHQLHVYNYETNNYYNSNFIVQRLNKCVT